MKKELKKLKKAKKNYKFHLEEFLRNRDNLGVCYGERRFPRKAVCKLIRINEKLIFKYAELLSQTKKKIRVLKVKRSKS